MAEPCFLRIPSKPDSPISYTLFPGSDEPKARNLIVFVNGLGLPASAWLASISLIRAHIKPCPAILTYDRFGQGLTSARDPLDKTKGSHDFLDVVTDLHEIISLVAKLLKFDTTGFPNGDLSLLLVGQSIGAPLIRLFTQHHPGLVAGMIILDSNIANINYSDIWPSPDAAGFDPKTVVAPDCPTIEEYKEARNKLAAIFDLNVKNAESLDRSTGPTLIPHADSPKLMGPEGMGPFVSIAGHDPVTFADGSLEKMGTPKSLTYKFTQAHWAQYNEALTNITDPDRVRGVVIANGCGHFIQVDDPNFVKEEVAMMLGKLDW